MSLLTDVWENWEDEIPKHIPKIENDFYKATNINTIDYNTFGGSQHINKLTNENLLLKKMVNNNNNKNDKLLLYIFLGYFIMFLLDTMVYM